MLQKEAGCESAAPVRTSPCFASVLLCAAPGKCRHYNDVFVAGFNQSWNFMILRIRLQFNLTKVKERICKQMIWDVIKVNDELIDLTDRVD